MKRICAAVIGIFILTSCFMSASADEIAMADGYYAEPDGRMIDYDGEFYDVMVIPSEVEGVPVKMLAAGLFYKAPVKTVYLEDGLEEIGDACFEGSGLDYIDVPSSVKRIGENAFRDCKNLTSLYIGSDKTEFGEGALSGTGYLYIGVPCNSDFLSLHDYIRDAKGDEEFSLDVMHTALVESMEEKDIFGNPLLYCETCGYALKGYDDIEIPFEDVDKDAWYYPYVVISYQFGILNGKSQTAFDPDAPMTLAEAAKIAACVYLCWGDDTFDFTADAGEAWYQPYVDFCYENGIIDRHIVFDWGKNATRAEMAYLFSRADRSAYEPNNDVPLTDIPDVDEGTMFADSILALYRRGIATGSDEYYTFYPDANVKRSEAAAFISRIFCFDLRVELPKG